MGAYAFLRLLQRPAFVLIVPFTGILIMMLLITAWSQDKEGVSQLDLSMLIVPLVIGTLVGQTIYDVRSRLFSWSLPGFQRKLGTSVVGLGFVFACLWVWAYLVWGGELAPLTAFACFLLIFMLSTVAQRTAPMLWVTLLLVVVWGDGFFFSLREYPALAALFALLIASACATAHFNSTLWRKALQSPHMQSIVNVFNVKEVARTNAAKLGRRATAKVWTLDRAGSELRKWMRAVKYENGGGLGRGRAALQAYGPVVAVAFMTASIPFDGRSIEEGWKCAFDVLFEPTGPRGPRVFVPIAMLQGVVAWVAILEAPSFLQRGWVYPVSREQRYKLIYRLSLRQGLHLVWTLVAPFSLLAVLLTVMSAESYDLSYLPGFYRGIIAIAIVLPLAQWVGFRLEQAGFRGSGGQWSVVLKMIGTFGFGFLVMAASLFWPRFMMEVAVPLQAALLLALACVSQALFYGFLVKHYRRADLI